MSQWGKITLWDAAADGNLEQVKARLSSVGSKINAQDTQGKTALHEAARWGHLNVIQYLIEQKADPNLKTKEGTSVLHLAALNGHNHVVEYLVKEVKFNINARDNYGDTPLITASGSGKAATVRLLLQLGADRTSVNNNKKTARDLAANADVADAFNEATYVSPTKY
eukprot:TRINITY_DN9048_c0_g1_i1.p1 TRINITY_DN9048_c0_g1~~TRINITY_DN9048_c0_g1_i1.p1  ORF type:complete len:167 (-),score=26.23 TRINITY_DN9048_c0_g1_i1:7-507(-)